jgi:hypothetical protein
LKGFERSAGRGPEDAVGVDRCSGEDGRQSVLDVGDRVTAISDGERQAYR